MVSDYTFANIIAFTGSLILVAVIVRILLLLFRLPVSQRTTNRLVITFVGIEAVILLTGGLLNGLFEGALRSLDQYAFWTYRAFELIYLVTGGVFWLYGLRADKQPGLRTRRISSAIVASFVLLLVANVDLLAAYTVYGHLM